MIQFFYSTHKNMLTSILKYECFIAATEEESFLNMNTCIQYIMEKRKQMSKEEQEEEILSSEQQQKKRAKQQERKNARDQTGWIFMITFLYRYCRSRSS